MAVWLSIASFLVLSAGAYVGGDVVYVLGNMVNRHAFRGAGTKWIALEPAEVDADGEIPEGKPDQGQARDQPARPRSPGRQDPGAPRHLRPRGWSAERGGARRWRDRVPWHCSRYRLDNGHVVRGPSVYDQPAYEVRAREGGGLGGSPAIGVISLPDPCLVVLVGAAGSGKSTLAARLFDPDSVLSSDAHRALVAGDEGDQAVTKTAFSILHRRLERRLAERQTTVVDATNVTSYARRSLVRRAAARGIPAVAIVLALEPSIVLARNATRPGRIVPESAVSQTAGRPRALPAPRRPRGRRLRRGPPGPHGARARRARGRGQPDDAPAMSTTARPAAAIPAAWTGVIRSRRTRAARIVVTTG